MLTKERKLSKWWLMASPECAKESSLFAFYNAHTAAQILIYNVQIL